MVQNKSSLVEEQAAENRVGALSGNRIGQAELDVSLDVPHHVHAVLHIAHALRAENRVRGGVQNVNRLGAIPVVVGIVVRRI